MTKLLQTDHDFNKISQDLFNSITISGLSVTRTALGKSEPLHLKELHNMVIELETSEMLSEILRLERSIFRNEIIKKMFYFILEHSLPSSQEDQLILTEEEFQQLPPMLQRYYRPNETLGYILEYKTHGRMRESLIKTLPVLQKDRSSRHCYLPIWRDEDSSNLGSMVPSLIGVHYQITEQSRVVSVHIRSCDIAFFDFDLWYFLALSHRINHELNKGGAPIFKVSILISNLHRYLPVESKR